VVAGRLRKRENNMRKAKDLIGKSIINQATGEQIATVRDVIFETDARSVAALLVDGGGWFRDAQAVAWESISGIGDVIMTSGESPIRPASEIRAMQEERGQDVRLTGLPVMSETGDRIGTVGDLFIDDNGAVVGYEVKQGFMTGNKFLFADNVQTVGRDAVIADTTQLTSVERARHDAHLHAPQRESSPAPTAETTVAAGASNLPAEGDTIIERRPPRSRTYAAPVAAADSPAAMPESAAMPMGAEPLLTPRSNADTLDPATHGDAASDATTRRADDLNA
jgi:uncharacterized protein YrrD